MRVVTVEVCRWIVVIPIPIPLVAINLEAVLFAVRCVAKIIKWKMEDGNGTNTTSFRKQISL